MIPPGLISRCTAARRAVLAQSGLFQREFGRVASQWKADGSRVTAIDLAISENIFSELAPQFPQDQFFSEELQAETGPSRVTSEYVWMLDPIDGTNNYALGIPQCAIGLALLHLGQPVYGAIYDLAGRELLHGGPGQGIYCGERPAAVRQGELTPQSLIGFHSPYDRHFAPHASLLAGNFKIRGLGSSMLHLAYVAIGRLDGVVDHNVKVWDIAAAVPLVLAAGGKVEYITTPPFPLQQFDLEMNRIFYVAGSAPTCERLRGVLGV